MGNRAVPARADDGPSSGSPRMRIVPVRPKPVSVPGGGPRWQAMRAGESIRGLEGVKLSCRSSPPCFYLSQAPTLAT